MYLYKHASDLQNDQWWLVAVSIYIYEFPLYNDERAITNWNFRMNQDLLFTII